MLFLETLNKAEFKFHPLPPPTQLPLLPSTSVNLTTLEMTDLKTENAGVQWELRAYGDEALVSQMRLRITEGAQRGNVGVSEGCPLGARHIQPREPCAALSIAWSLCPHVCLSAHSSVCPPVHSPISPSIHPSLPPSAHLSLHPSSCSSVHSASRSALFEACPSCEHLGAAGFALLACFQLLCSAASSTRFSWLQALGRCFTSPSLSFSICKNGP